VRSNHFDEMLQTKALRVQCLRVKFRNLMSHSLQRCVSQRVIKNSLKDAAVSRGKAQN
jgi:hypothetical protein